MTLGFVFVLHKVLIFLTPQAEQPVCYRRQERGSLFLIRHARNGLRLAPTECVPQLLITTKQGLS